MAFAAYVAALTLVEGECVMLSFVCGTTQMLSLFSDAI